MRALSRLLACSAVLACLGGSPARAQDSAAAQVEDKLKGYDPATVAAAAQFAKSFNFSAMVSKSAPYLAEQVGRKLRDKNPDLTEEQTEAFISAFLQSLFEDKGQTVERAIVLNIVEIMPPRLKLLAKVSATATVAGSASFSLASTCAAEES